MNNRQQLNSSDDKAESSRRILRIDSHECTNAISVRSPASDEGTDNTNVFEWSDTSIDTEEPSALCRDNGIFDVAMTTVDVGQEDEDDDNIPNMIPMFARTRRMYTPPTTIDDILRSYLSNLPFEAVSLWASKNSNSDMGHGGVLLSYAGGYSVTSSLEDWLYYSKSFKFRVGEEMPGRIFESQEPEFRRDVAAAPNSFFVKRDGARSPSVRSAYGVPLQQGDKKFVVIFCSSSRLHGISEHLEEYISQKVSEWHIPCEHESIEEENYPE